MLKKLELVSGIEPLTCALRMRTSLKMEVFDQKATALRAVSSANREQSSAISFVSMNTLGPQ
ncbi:MAG: hypothetical protein EHM89_08210 [Acidobacteria bacterium]|jgi:hypothetical protein|nr:MAG: hypothetical protein EHM89_08210 [Acidobacteriota bacterium]